MKLINRKWLRVLILGTTFILIYKLINNFKDIKDSFMWLTQVLSPLFFGVALALFFYMPARIIENFLSKNSVEFIRKKARVLGVLLLYIFSLLFLLLGFSFIVPRVYTSLQELANKIPEYTKAADTYFSSNIYFAELSTEKLLNMGISKYVSATKITKYFKAMKGFTGTLISIFVSVVISIYLLIDREEITEYLSKIKRCLLKERFLKVTMYLKKTIKLFCSYFAGLSADALAVAILVSLGLWLLGVKYPLVIGIIIGIGNLVPVFGCIAATVVSGVLTLISGGFLSLVTMLLYVLTVYALDSYFIQPFIVGKSTGVKPVVSLISVTVFGRIFGVLGVLLAVPVSASLKMIVDDWLSTKKPL